MQNEVPELSLVSDDFDRLGLRPNEARPRIIRAAASMTAQRFCGPDSLEANGVHKEALAELSATVYRVLDPRRRDSAIERALLSQPESIPTIVESWLHPKYIRAVRPTPSTSFHSDDLSTVKRDDVFPSPNYRPPSQWELVVQRWVFYARARVVWGMLLLALLLGMLLARQVRTPTLAGLSDPETPTIAKPTELHPPLRTPEARYEQPATSTAEIKASREGKEPGKGDDSEQPKRAREARKAKQGPAGAPIAIEMAEAVADLSAHQPAGGEETTVPPSLGAAEVDSPIDWKVAVDQALNGIFEHASQDFDFDDSIAQDPAMQDEAMTLAPLNYAEDIVPLPEAIVETPQADEPRAAPQVPSSIGSVIFAGEFELADQYLTQWQAEFALTSSRAMEMLCEYLIQLSDHPADANRVLQWSCITAERLLQREEVELATQVFRWTAPALPRADSEDWAEQYKRYGDSMPTIARMQSRAQEITTVRTLDDVQRGEALQVGRYRCFMLRDWAGGLAWLAQSSDPRLSMIAVQEIQWLGAKQPSSAAGLELAEQWMERAQRMRGRMRDSIYLHAEEILDQLGGRDTDDLVALEITRLRKQISEAIGLHVKLVSSLTSERQTNLLDKPTSSPQRGMTPLEQPQDKTSGQDAASVEKAEEQAGMYGHLKVNQQDQRIAILYPTGTELDQEVIDQIVGAFRLAAGRYDLRFEGYFNLVQETHVDYVVGGANADGQQVRLQIGGEDQRLRFSDGQARGTIRLPAGTHVVVWSLTADRSRMPPSSVTFRDVSTAEPLEIRCRPDSGTAEDRFVRLLRETTQ